MNDLEENYVSLDEFNAEEKKVKVGFYYQTLAGSATVVIKHGNQFLFFS